MPSRPTGRRFATPRITTRIRPLPPTTISGSSRSAEAGAKNITADNPASDSTPLYSPDGRYIAYRAQQRPGYESDRFRLMLYDRNTGEKKNLTEELDEWVGTFVWSTNSKLLFFVAENAGSAPIRSIAVDQPFKTMPPSAEDVKRGFTGYEPLSTPGLLTLPFGYFDDLAFSKDGKILFSTHMSIKGSNEIYQQRVDKVPTSGEPVTHFNDDLLSQIEMSALESFWFTGAHNDKVEGFLVKPPNFDA